MLRDGERAVKKTVVVWPRLAEIKRRHDCILKTSPGCHGTGFSQVKLELAFGFPNNIADEFAIDHERAVNAHKLAGVELGFKVADVAPPQVNAARVQQLNIVTCRPDDRNLGHWHNALATRVINGKSCDKPNLFFLGK